MKQIKYNNLEDMLDSQNADDRGKYFICNCPSCEHKEAFIYKNNPRLITCNRAENCGERHFVKYNKINSIENINLESKKEEFPDLTEEQVKAIDWTERFFDYMREYHISPTFEHGYRGLSNDNLSNGLIDIRNKNLASFMFYKMDSLFDKSYYQNDFMTDRNLVAPIYDDDNNLERVVLRSSISEGIDPKEIQLDMNPSKDTRDFFINLNKGSQRMVFTESLFDALSFREIDSKSSYVALTGVQKTNRIKKYIQENPSKFENKKVVVAFDNDNAGHQGTEDIKSFLSKQNIDNVEFDYSSVKTKNIKDANDFLQFDKQSFKQTYKESLMKMQEHSVDKKKDHDIEM